MAFWCHSMISSANALGSNISIHSPRERSLALKSEVIFNLNSKSQMIRLFGISAKSPYFCTIFLIHMH